MTMRLQLFLALVLFSAACEPLDEPSPVADAPPCEITVNKGINEPLVELRQSERRYEATGDEPACPYNDYTVLNDEPIGSGSFTFTHQGPGFCLDGVTEDHQFFRVGPVGCGAGEEDWPVVGGQHQSQVFENTLLLVNETDQDLGMLRAAGSADPEDWLEGRTVPAGSDWRFAPLPPSGDWTNSIATLVVSSGQTDWLTTAQPSTYWGNSSPEDPWVARGVAEWTAHSTGELCDGAVFNYAWYVLGGVNGLNVYNAFWLQLWGGPGTDQILPLGFLQAGVGNQVPVFAPPGQWYFGLSLEGPDAPPGWAVGPFTCSGGEDISIIIDSTAGEEPFEVSR